MTFSGYSEEKAAEYLAKCNYYFRLSAYRILFERRVGGMRDGEYVGLDFGDLVTLSDPDQRLRNVMFSMTVEIEHAAKTSVMDMIAADEREDGYAIVADYFSSLSPESLRRRQNEFTRLHGGEYGGQALAKYGELPIWAFLEFSSFGAFADFYRFCSLRWQNKQMRCEHYIFRQCVALRNAAAHNLPIINCFNVRQGNVHVAQEVANAVSRIGISKRVRAAKLKNPRLQQIVTASYLHARYLDEKRIGSEAESMLDRWSRAAENVMARLPNNDILCSSLGFLIKVFDSWSKGLIV